MSVRGATPKPRSRILVAIGDPAMRSRVLHLVRELADATDDISSPEDGWADPRVEQERVVLIMGLTTRSGPASPAWVEAW